MIVQPQARLPVTASPTVVLTAASFETLAVPRFLTYRNCEVTGLCCSELVSMRGQEAQWQVIGTKGNVFHVGVHVTPAAQPDQHFLSISFFLEKTATEYHRA